MSSSLQTITIYLLGIIQFAFQQAIILKLTKSEYTIRRLLLSATFIHILHSVFARFIPAYAILLIIIWIGLLTFSYSIIFRQAIIKSCFLGIGQMVLVTCMEFVSQLIMVLFGGKLQQYTFISQLISRIYIALFLIIIYFIVSKTKLIAVPTNLKRETKNLWLVYLIFLLLFTHPTILYIETNQQLLTSEIEIYNLILFVLFFCFNAITIRNYMKMSSISQQLEIQHLYSNTLEQSLQQLRGFKHDFANILNTINGLAENQIQKDYLRSLNTDFLNISTTEIVNTEFKQNPLLYGILLSKLSLAELRGITFRVTVLCEIVLNYCDPVDFTRIVGILLDNALEAAVESEEKLVELSISGQRGRYSIVVKNSCLEADSIRDRIFESGFTTKENHSGLGLSQVKKLIKKYQKQNYDMRLNTNFENKICSQALYL